MHLICISRLADFPPNFWEAKDPHTFTDRNQKTKVTYELLQNDHYLKANMY